MNEYDYHWCLRTLNDLFKWPITIDFRTPVNSVESNATDYYNVIKHPMDLSTIKQKLNDKIYKNVDSFKNDLVLIADNAILYNGEDSPFGYMASDLKKWINKHFDAKSKDYASEWVEKLNQTVSSIQKHIENRKMYFQSQKQINL